MLKLQLMSRSIGALCKVDVDGVFKSAGVAGVKRRWRNDGRTDEK